MTDLEFRTKLNNIGIKSFVSGVLFTRMDIKRLKTYLGTAGVAILKNNKDKYFAISKNGILEVVNAGLHQQEE